MCRRIRSKYLLRTRTVLLRQPGAALAMPDRLATMADRANHGQPVQPAGRPGGVLDRSLLLDGRQRHVLPDFVNGLGLTGPG